MENIAHTMVGFVLARSGLDRKSGLATTALVLGSSLPDADVVALAKGRLAFIDCHRARTHSIVGGTVLALVMGASLYGIDRIVIRRLLPTAPRARLRPLLAISVAAVLMHLGLDSLNDYGIRLALPFSDRWYYGDLIFIVDPWFWLILGGGLHVPMDRGRVAEALAWLGWMILTVPVLALSQVPMPARAVWLLGLLALAAIRALGRRPTRAQGARRTRLSAAIALIALAAYVLAVAAVRSVAMSDAASRIRDEARGAEIRRPTLLPKPADPFHWTLMYERDDEIVAATVAAFGRHAGQARNPVRFRKNLENPAVQAALGTPEGQVARRFSRYLFADLQQGPPGTTVTFRDARFVVRGTREFSIFVVPPPPGSPAGSR